MRMTRLLRFALLPFVALALQTTPSRRQFLSTAATVPLIVLPSATLAFEGGVGGLGKTKPQTGVVLREGSAPIQNKQGIISGEILTVKSNPILVEFQTPYPLLTSSAGLEARDLQQPESAFVQVIEGVSSSGTNGKALYKVLTESILGSKGKYGAYGEPVDIKFSKASADGPDNILKATFTTFTPAMRESERKILLNCQYCGDNTLVVLVTGTTVARFKTQEKVLMDISKSFVALDAPKSGLSR